MPPTSPAPRLLLVGALLALSLGPSSFDAGAAPSLYAGPVPDAPCAAGAQPESTQGRVPRSEVESGRAAKGYRCNTVQVGHSGESGGFHVWRYVDAAGHVCGFYDSTLLIGRDASSILRRGPGTVVLDMSDPAKPVETAVLATPAMDQPHESLRLNTKRGLLVAVAGSPSTAPGVLDVYDVSKDCLHPALQSTTPLGILGHESGFAPDGMTYWAASYVQGRATLTAIDLSNAVLPSIVFLTTDYVFHGMSLSDDGNRLFAADQGDTPGFRILDVSEVQARKTNPTVRQLSYLTWPEVTIPQYSEAVTIQGRKYAVEVDEYNRNGRVGAGRIIDVSDETRPKVVSNIRLAVHSVEAQVGEQLGDYGASAIAQGYSGHYCSVPQRTNPNLLACSFIVSGLRLFDIRNPLKPVEVGYFNPPVLPTPETPLIGRVGAFSMSQPAWDVARDQVWFSDGNSGFYAVRLVGAAKAALHGTSAVITGVAGPPAAARPPAAAPRAVAPPIRPTPSLPSTGLPDGVPVLATAALLFVLAVRRRVGGPTGS